MNISRLLAASIIAMSTSAPEASNSAERCPESGAKVFVSAAGRVTLNGKVVSASEVGRAIERLNPQPTVICYARDNPEREPHPDALLALEAVASARLPVALFKDKAFTERVKG
jgi:hypothetical protein